MNEWLQEAKMLGRTTRVLVAVGTCAFAVSAYAPQAMGQTAAPHLLSATSDVGHSVSGTIANGDGTPIDDAQVELRRGDSTTNIVRTDSTGRFRFNALALGAATIHVRRLGYHERAVPVDVVADRTASVYVKLEESVEQIDGMSVDGAGEEMNTRLIEFYARAQNNHFGYFIDQQQLEKLHPQQTSDALRAVPGVLVRPARLGNVVKIRGCSPLVWVDGLRAPNGELDELTRGADVAAIEIYTSIAGVPAQYTDRSATCGTILVWLKTG
ncbi:MAG TPA: carboxypeptidase regulatory-like domain-containing protein [Gemmatimonadaceae bacterium]|jgi:hypothetical protein